MKYPKRVTSSVKLVTRMVREIETEVLVVVENRGVDRAVQKSEDCVGRRRHYGGLEICHDEIVVGLED